MNNVVRKAVRVDYYDFYVNPKKRYKEPKSDFKFIE